MVKHPLPRICITLIAASYLLSALFPPAMVTSPLPPLPCLSLPLPRGSLGPQTHSPHAALTTIHPTYTLASLPHTHSSSMPNHVTGRPPWPHQCQHERPPQGGPGPVGSVRL